MTQEEKQTLLQGMFQGADLRGAQIIAVNEGTVYYQKHSGDQTVTKTEEEVKDVVSRLMEERDEHGDYIMRDQDQWYAVFRVLSSLCGYPQKPKDFATTMANLGVDNLRVPCKYESLRKVSLHNLPQNVELWHQYQNTADQYTMKQVTVAVRLMEMMG